MRSSHLSIQLGTEFLALSAYAGPTLTAAEGAEGGAVDDPGLRDGSGAA